MSLVTGFALGMLVVVLGAGGLTVFALYLRNRDENMGDITSHELCQSLDLEASDALRQTISAIAGRMGVSDENAVHIAINCMHASLFPASDDLPSKEAVDASNVGQAQ